MSEAVKTEMAPNGGDACARLQILTFDTLRNEDISSELNDLLWKLKASLLQSRSTGQ